MNLSEDVHFDEIFDKAKSDARLVKLTTPETPSQVIACMKFWWSRQYNRPLKDPLLSTYTIYDLLYEYHLYKDSDNPTAAANEIINDSKTEVDALVKEMDEEFMNKEFGESWNMNENDFK
jgi:hypothetical protein